MFRTTHTTDAREDWGIWSERYAEFEYNKIGSSGGPPRHKKEEANIVDAQFASAGGAAQVVSLLYCTLKKRLWCTRCGETAQDLDIRAPSPMPD